MYLCFALANYIHCIVRVWQVERHLNSLYIYFDLVPNFLFGLIELFSGDNRVGWYMKFKDSIRESKKRKYLSVSVFQAEPPYADSAKFDAAYSDLINRIRKQFSGVKIICCATKVLPTDLLKPHVKVIVEKQKTQGYTDISYFEYVSENGALCGHPHIYDHQAIAESLIPVISEMTGWRRTDNVRGKWHVHPTPARGHLPEQYIRLFIRSIKNQFYSILFIIFSVHDINSLSILI